MCFFSRYERFAPKHEDTKEDTALGNSPFAQTQICSACLLSLVVNLGTAHLNANPAMLALLPVGLKLAAALIIRTLCPVNNLPSMALTLVVVDAQDLVTRPPRGKRTVAAAVGVCYITADPSALSAFNRPYLHPQQGIVTDGDASPAARRPSLSTAASGRSTVSGSTSVASAALLAGCEAVITLKAEQLRIGLVTDSTSRLWPFCICSSVFVSSTLGPPSLARC
jgi:hypothetical protein